MISFQGISKQYGERRLFQNVSLVIGDRERVAVVGANGAGKTTLLKIIAGEVEPDSGRISASRFNTVGYLPQDGIRHSGHSLFDEAAGAVEGLVLINRRMEEINGEIEKLSRSGDKESEEFASLLEELGKMHHHLEYAEGYAIDAKIKKVLGGLGFAEKDFGRSTEEFSGGWQMRIAIARLLLKEPTILLLDEPTNHLDIHSLQWLESYLRSYEGSVVLVSHDRRFLDNMTRRTIEISRGELSEYRGNYSFYLEEKARRFRSRRLAREGQQKKIDETMRFVDRFRFKATKARQVQSRLRMLDKMEKIETADEEKDIAFDFPQPRHSGRVLLELDRIAKAYNGVSIFHDLSLTVERGDRIALMGPNGSGKSTLARIIAGLEPFQEGSIKRGHHVTVSYYAQNQAETLDPDRTVLQIVEDVATGDHRQNLRSLLGRFLFSEEDVFKQVSVLSGGEKSRLALARMLLIPANLLILDEPTNHLDLSSKDVLQEALARFQGAFIIASHDRDFLEPLIDRVLDFRDGRLRITLGTVDDYLAEEQEEAPATLQRGPSGRSIRKKSPLHLEKERRREEAQRRQKVYRRQKPLSDALKNLENEIARKEVRKKELEESLADGRTYENGQAARSLNREYGEITVDLKTLYEEWMCLQQDMEAIELEEKGDA